jgi:guanyl-specific ribonuclease Sa
VHAQGRFPQSVSKLILVTFVVIASMLGLSTVASPARASVYSSCTISRCSDAVSANSTWKSLGYPTKRGWVDWPNGQCNYAGGTYYNDEGELPGGDSYLEYDVYPRSCGASRDAYRIVVDTDTGAVWFSPNHYTDFYRL